jgi:acetyl esterase/lipase
MKARIALLLLGVRLRLPVSWLIRSFRRVGAALDDPTLVPAMVDFEPEGVAGLLDVAYGGEAQMTLDVFRPLAAAGPLPAIVWVHGGGWVGGTKNALRSYLRVLASHGFVTVGVDYTWAPERRYPEQVEQAGRALAHLRDHADEFGIAADRFVIAGDSAGAHIAAQVARAITDPGYAGRAGIRVPAFAPADLRAVVLTSGPFRLDAVQDPDGMGAFGDFILRAYTGTRRYVHDPVLQCASLVHDMDASFPPTYVSAGTIDPMLRDSRALSESLREHGVPVETGFYPDDHDPALPHEFAVDLRRPEAREVMAAIVRFAGHHAQIQEEAER